MQIENDNMLFGIQNIYQTSAATNVFPQAQTTARSQDTVQISSEARALYEQSLREQERAKQAARETLIEEQDQSAAELSANEEESQSLAAQRFSEILAQHKPSGEQAGNETGDGNKTDSSSSGGGGGGGGSSSESSSDAIEEIKNAIQQVSAELASVAGETLTSGNSQANSRVGQLQTKLAQLESQLAQLEAEATTEA